MKLTALMENTTVNDACVCEHGLSLIIEANGRKVLFDAGQSGNFVKNAQVLGIDLAQVDTCVLSHGHYDHSDGFPAFFQINDHARLYAHKGYDLIHLHGIRTVGVSGSFIRTGRIDVVDVPRMDLGDGFELLSYNDVEPYLPINSDGMDEYDGTTKRPELFTHEHYLLVREGDTCLMVTGCTHRGVVNVVHWSEDEGVTHLVGGFHLMNVNPADERIDQTAQELLRYPIQYMSCHCTGRAQFDRLKELMGDKLQYFATGTVVEL